MSQIEKVLAEDLKAAIEAFKGDAFDNVNVFANRMMSNSIFGESKKIFLPGFFVKDVAMSFLVLKTRQSAMAFSTAKAHGFTYIEKLSKCLPDIDEEKLWEDFIVYSEKIREFEMSEWEAKSYSSNVKFTNESFKWLLSYLKTNQELLSDSKNMLFRGILTEMNRIYKVHSASTHDCVIYCLLVALDRNYEYVCRLWNRPNERAIDERRLKELIIPAVDKILALSEREFKVEEADSLLWDLVKTWREFFILYGELLPPSIAVQKGIELPEELKNKLTDTLTKTLQKEM